MHLTYSDTGSGEPIVFIHGGIVADAFKPLIEHLDLSTYRAISYHRRGYGQSPRQTEPVTTEQQAYDVLDLMRQVGIKRAHVAGYSYGGAIALQLALDAPEAVRSLALFEPLVPSTLDEDSLRFFAETGARAFAKFSEGDQAGALDLFAQGAFGPDWRPRLEAALPGAVAQAEHDAEVMFTVELPAIQQWQFGPDEAKRIQQPVLLAFHNDPAWDGFKRTHTVLRSWLPETHELEMAHSTTHLLQIVAPGDAATGLAGFVSRSRFDASVRS